MRALLSIVVVLLAGCGQSGDLYLPPKQPPPAESAPPAAPPETPPEEDKDKK